MQQLFALTFNELATDRQAKILEEEILELINFITDTYSWEGEEFLCLFQGEIGEELLAAIKEVEGLNTPWFLHECFYGKAQAKLRQLAMNDLSTYVFVSEVTDTGKLVKILEQGEKK